MKSLNVLDEEGMKKYKSRMFSQEGYNTLLNYVKSLARLYFEQKKYPFWLGIVLGVPLMKYAQCIASKELLYERLLSYSQLLGINEIEAVLNNGTKLSIKIGGENEQRHKEEKAK